MIKDQGAESGMNKRWRIPWWFALLILASLNACSLLTIERITPIEDEVQGFEATVDALKGQIDRQDDMVSYMATQVSLLATENAQFSSLISYLATRGPASGTAVVTPPETNAALVSGEVVIEDGSCCVGATAGDDIEITVRFSASGRQAPVTEMRYKVGGFADLEQGFYTEPWGLFREQLTFTYRVPINWTGFYVRVQYRDSLGNLSPIYTDDISVEGAPPTPTPGG
jgi:hypothetical protein